MIRDAERLTPITRLKLIVIPLLIIIMLLFVAWLGLLGWRSVYVYQYVARPAGEFPLDLQWQTDLGFLSHERPVYHDKLIVFPTNWSWHAVQAQTGQAVWSQSQFQSPIDYQYLHCINHEYIVFSSHGPLSIHNTQTGELIWQRRFGNKTVTCSKNTMFSIGFNVQQIASYELKTGMFLWESDQRYSNVIYASSTDELIANWDWYWSILDTQTGQVKDTIDVDATVLAPQDWLRGSLHTVDNNELFAWRMVVDIEANEILLKTDYGNSWMPPTVRDEWLYLSSNEVGIVAYERSGYTLQWTYQPPPLSNGRDVVPVSALATLDDIGYAVFSDATVRAIDLQTGQEVGYWQPSFYRLVMWPVCENPYDNGACQFSPARAGIATSDDMIFVSMGDGVLYAFGP